MQYLRNSTEGNVGIGLNYGKHHLARRVRASMTALEAGLASRTALGQDTAQTLALAAVELSNYCAIYDEVTRQNTPVVRKA